VVMLSESGSAQRWVSQFPGGRLPEVMGDDVY
jgi:hypothetical protein